MEMGQARYYTWPEAVSNGISATQTLGGAGNLSLNGSLARPTSNPFVNYIDFNGISRSVTLTAAGDLSARNFTITGTDNNGIIISEVIAGPNADTVETDNFFNTVTQISVNGAAAGVSAGSGTTGVLPINTYNYQSSYGAFRVQVVVTNDIQYSFEATLFDDSNSDAPIFRPFVDMDDSSTSETDMTNIAFRSSQIRIESSTDGSLQVAMMQQGIN